MITINKLISSSPVDYAAEELKKYLRMMMPEGGDIKIAYNPDAKDGFRLGLMQDLGLDPIIIQPENTHQEVYFFRHYHVKIQTVSKCFYFSSNIVIPN